MSNPIRILQILPSINICGGVENYVMNYYRHIDKTKVQFDFITHSIPETSFKKEIEEFGGKIYKMPSFHMSSAMKIMDYLDGFFAQHDEYKVIHCHMANAALFYFRIAKKHGIKVRILHSHQSQGADILSHRLRNYPLLFCGKLYSNYNVACSKLAGDFLFKDKEYIIINNAINPRKFIFNMEVRAKIRNQFRVSNKFVVGHVGRFCNQKNHLFLLDIFNQLHKKNPNSVLMLVGGGELEFKIKNKINDLNLQESVIFTGISSNTNELYQAMDVFVLPSLYEGLPVVGVEAQATGLRLFVSDTVTEELKITNMVAYMSLKQTAEEWADVIISCQNCEYTRKDMTNDFAAIGFDIVSESIKLEEKYLQLYYQH